MGGGDQHFVLRFIENSIHAICTPPIPPPRFPPRSFRPPHRHHAERPLLPAPAISAPAIFERPPPQALSAPTKDQGKDQTRKNKTTRNRRNQRRREQTDLEANETTAAAGPPKPIPKRHAQTRNNETAASTGRRQQTGERRPSPSGIPCCGWAGGAGDKRWGRH